MRRWLMAAVVLGAGLLAGCSGGDGNRYRLSGEAKFDGQPIPYGDVVFTPDGSKQNHGPQGIAPIRDGRFDTSGSAGKGFAGGPTVIHVTGLTGPGGKLLCEYEYQADLPRESGTFTIEVPKAGAARGGKGGDI